MTFVHKWIGVAIVLAFATLMVWGLVARIRRREPGGAFWGVLAFAQITVGIQFVIGVILLAVHGIHSRPILHYFYGGFFPVVVLVIAHVVARSLERDRWVPFAWAGFFCFGLTLRALETGCGGITLSILRDCLL